MRKGLLLFLALTLPLALQFALPAAALDRGLGDPNALYIAKGSRKASLSGAYRHYGAGDGNGGYNLLGLIENLDASATFGDLGGGFDYFIKQNTALGLHIGYQFLNGDLNNAHVMVADIENKHIRRGALVGHIHLRGYIPLFNSKILALFHETRLSGMVGTSQVYSQLEEGKEGSHSDLRKAALGLHAGISVFLTDNASVEISLPLLEGGYYSDKQSTNQASSVPANHWFLAYKPDFLGLQLGISLIL